MKSNRWFLRLWVLVVGLLVFKLYPIVDSYIPKEQVVDFHVMRVTQGMLDFVDNKDQLALVIGHELGHIILGHTQADDHKTEYEYHSDLIGALLAHKAGYSLCGGDELWQRMGENYLSLHSGSHPNSFIRSYYMKMPECVGVEIVKEKVTAADAIDILNKMLKNVEGNIRYRMWFGIHPSQSVNAFVYTVTKDK